MSIEALRDELDVHQEDIEQVDTEMDDLPDEQGENDKTQVDDDLGFSFDEPEKSEDGEKPDPFAGQEAPEWVKQLRKENRELKKQLKQSAPQPQLPALREKPTLYDYDYDSEAYEADLEKWYTEKAQHDEAVKSEQAKYQHYEDRYKSSVDNMRAKVTDYDEIEETIIDSLSPQKQALLKVGVDDPAKFVYLLGKSPNKLAKLSQLDEVQFLKQVAIMEHQMIAKSRNPNKPQPKSHELSGNAGGGADAKLAKLEAEAEKTGDRSKVLAYKKQMKK